MPWFEHGGTRIYYEETGSGDPVLFLPGFSESITYHSRLRDVLSASYRVIAADLPGYGRSEPQPRTYTPTFHEDDAGALSALLRATVDGPVHLIGYSDGGEVALMMAALFQELARSAVTWGAVGFGSDAARDIVTAFYTAIDSPVPLFEAYSKQLIGAYGEQNARTMTQNYSRALAAIIERGGDISLSKAHRISCPILLIVGEHDTPNPILLAEQYAAKAKDGRAIEVEGAGHDVHVSHQEWFTRTLLDWLAGPASRKSLGATESARR